MKTLARLIQVACLPLALTAVEPQIPRYDPIPLGVLYGLPELQEQDILPAPDGAHVAYVVRQLPPESTIASRDRWQSNGAPESVAGTQIYVADAQGKSAVRLAEASSAAWRPSWSPDSRTVAFYAVTDGVVALWTYDLGSGRCQRLGAVVVKPKLWIGDEVQWSPDSRTLYVPIPPAGRPAGYERKEARAVNAERPAIDRIFTSGSESPPVEKRTEADDGLRAAQFLTENNSTIAAVALATGHSRIVVPATARPRPAVFRISATGRWLGYLSVWSRGSLIDDTSMRQSLAVADSRTGTLHTIAEDLPQTYKDYYRLTYAWHPTQDMLVFVKQGGVYRVDFGPDGPGQPVRLGEELGQLALGVHWFSRDGNFLVVGTDPDEAGKRMALRQASPTGFAVIPLHGGPTRRIALDTKQREFINLVQADGRTVWQPEENTLTVLVREFSTGELNVVRYNLADASSRTLWRGRARIKALRATANGREIFGSYEDLGTPLDVYRFTADFSQKTRVSHVAPILDQVAPPRLEVFETRIPLHDHRFASVRTAVLLPANLPPGQTPPGIVTFYPDDDSSTNIECFGGGNRAGVPASVFTSRGYAILYPYVKTGPGGSPGNVIDEMVDSLLPQVYRAAEKGYVDVTRLALQGNSFGGYATAAIVTQTNLFRAAVPTNGIYDIISNAFNEAPAGSIAWTENRQPRLGVPLWSAQQKYIAASPVFLADKIKTPLLILQGGDDSLKPQAEELFVALRRLDKPAQLGIYAGGGHWLSLWPRQQAVDATQRMLDFYERHLGKP